MLVDEPQNRDTRLALRAREDDIGADRKPERIVADNRNLDEHAQDSKDDRQQRQHKPEVHGAISPRCNEAAKTLLTRSRGNVRVGDVLARSKPRLRRRDLTLAMRVRLRLWC